MNASSVSPASTIASHSNILSVCCAGQLNDLDLQNQTLSATLNDINSRYGQLETAKAAADAEFAKLPV